MDRKVIISLKCYASFEHDLLDWHAWSEELLPLSYGGVDSTTLEDAVTWTLYNKLNLTAVYKLFELPDLKKDYGVLLSAEVVLPERLVEGEHLVFTFLPVIRVVEVPEEHMDLCFYDWDEWGT